MWVSGGGNRVVFRRPNGDLIFTNDGDIDRSGAPAKIINGIETWWRYGKQIADPRPLPPKVDITTGARPSMSTSRFTGARHNDDDMKTIAKRLREDIKHAQYAGLLPSGVVRVTSDGSGRSKSVNVSFEGVARDALNPRREEQGESWHSEDGRAWNDTLEQLTGQYNYWEEGANASESLRKFSANIGFRNDARTW
jgi:hypothetical protein